jgi:hypothetical protein
MCKEPESKHHMYVEYRVGEKKNVLCKYIASLCIFVIAFLLFMLAEGKTTTSSSGFDLQIYV